MGESLVFWFIISALGVLRLSIDFTKHEGPFRVYELFRNRFTKDNWFARGIRCPYCVSFWISAIAAAMVISITNSSLLTYPLLWCGLAGSFHFTYKWSG